MDFSVLANFFRDIIFFALHISNSGYFPKPLKKQEEKDLITKAENGDSQAKSILIEHNLRLVVHIIKKYYSNCSDPDDLISIGTVGLIKGVNSYKSEKGTRLATYAARCIENAILSLRLLQKKKFPLLNT